MPAILERPSARTKPTLSRKPRPPKTAAPRAGERLLTAEEYWETCNSDHSELISGRVIEHMPPGGEHGELALFIGSLILQFVRKHRLGRVFVESGYRLTSGDLRSPDVSFIEYSRLPDGCAPRAFIEATPNLAIEVISPGDEWSKVEEKVQLYLHCGTEMVWLIDPMNQTATVRAQKTSRVFDKTNTLSGEPVLPGFKLPLKDIFDI